MTVGSHVRVLSIPESVLRPLPPDERADGHRYHSLGLDAHEMERAEADDRPAS